VIDNNKLKITNKQTNKQTIISTHPSFGSRCNAACREVMAVVMSLHFMWHRPSLSHAHLLLLTAN